MEVRPVPAAEWRFVYACGHRHLFTAPGTPDELLRLTDWLEQHWNTCSQCDRPTQAWRASSRVGVNS